MLRKLWFEQDRSYEDTMNMINIWSDENIQGEYLNGQGETLQFKNEKVAKKMSEAGYKELEIIMVIESSCTGTGQKLQRCSCGQVV